MSIPHLPPPLPPARATTPHNAHSARDGASTDAKPDRVSLADASKRGLNSSAAKAHGVAHEDTAAAADARAREQRAEDLRDERALAARDARAAAARDASTASAADAAGTAAARQNQIDTEA